jgi:Ca2+-binding RTX toxin-like protein
VLTLNDDTSSITEDNSDPTLTDSGTLSFTDVDTNDTHNVTVSYNEDANWTGGSLSEDQITSIITGHFTATKDSASTGTWDYSVADSALQFLNQNETVTFSYDVVVTDNSGAVNNNDTQTVTVTLTGVNDTPTITSSCDVTWQENSDAPAYTVVASDADQTAVLTYSLSGLDAGSFTIDESTGEIFFNDPCCGYGDYENPQDLEDSGVGALGNDNIYAIIVTATDEFGASVDKNVNITVDNVNPEIFNLTSNYDDVCAGNGDDTVQGTFAQLLQGDDVDGQGGTDTLIIGGGLATDNLAIDAENNYAEVNGSDDISISNFERFDFRNFSGTVNFTGLVANNWVWSGAGNDYLVGGLSGDYINGGTGADVMLGGRGSDDYYVDNVGDVVTEGFNSGYDSVYSTVTYTLGNNVENLILQNEGGAINGTGNNLNNRIEGNSGNNTLNGAAGIDTLIGGAGNDTYIVDNTSETITENGGEGTDTIQFSATFSLASLANVENLTLTGSTAINGTGNAGNNVITGNSGNNTLDGGAGIDTLIGGTGNDTYIVDNVSETITENGGEGTDTIQSSVTFTLASLTNVENLTLTGSNAINGTGNAGNNVITGNSGNNTLDGGAGIDTLIGGTGNDTYIVNTTTDVITENAGEGTDTIQSSVAFTLASLANVENLTLTGTTAINGADNAGNNILTGNASNNTLNSSGGNDTLNGGDGNDFLLGGAGNNALNGGVGLDTAYYYTATAAVTVNLATGITSNNGQGGTDTLSGIEYVYGSNTAGDNLTGDSGANVLYGYGGNDTLNGGDGNDVLYGGTGNNIINGGNGIDTAYYYDATTGITVNLSSANPITINNGQGGTDTLTGIENVYGSNTLGDNLTGDSGANVLYGYGGNDTLTGGLGNDTLSLGVDTVTDAVNYTSGDGSDNVFNFVRGVGGDRLNFTAIANIDVRVSGTSTQFRVGDATIGNAGFGTGTLLLTTNAATGFVAGDVGVNLFNLSNPTGFSFS